MAMDYKKQLALINVGFLNWEVREYATAIAPDGSPQIIDLTSQTWQQAMNSRRNWIRSLDRQFQKVHHRHITQWEINRIVNTWYSRRQGGEPKSPWDFIKKEYRPPKGLTDYQQARQKKAKKRAESLYKERKVRGKPYG